jgi:hypothetical protein
MNQETTIQAEAKVLSAESKPYDVNGNTGTSHKVRLLVGSAIYPCKTTPEVVKQLQDYIGDDVNVSIEFTSVRENIGVTLHSFEA